MEQLIPIGCTFLSGTQVVADVLPGSPTDGPQLRFTAKAVVSLLQQCMVATWIYLLGCASSVGP